MTRFWFKHRWLRRTTYRFVVLLSLGLVALFFVADGYMPSEDRTHIPPLTFQCNLVSQWVLERNLDWSVTDQLLPKMKMPALVIWGKQDTIEDSTTYVQRWHRLDPQATIVVLDHAGHLVYDDQLEKVHQLLLNFLAA